jgi:hypothetical protein
MTGWDLIKLQKIQDGGHFRFPRYSESMPGGKKLLGQKMFVSTRGVNFFSKWPPLTVWGPTATFSPFTRFHGVDRLYTLTTFHTCLSQVSSAEGGFAHPNLPFSSLCRHSSAFGGLSEPCVPFSCFFTFCRRNGLYPRVFDVWALLEGGTGATREVGFRRTPSDLFSTFRPHDDTHVLLALFGPFFTVLHRFLPFFTVLHRFFTVLHRFSHVFAPRT